MSSILVFVNIKHDENNKNCFGVVASLNEINIAKNRNEKRNKLSSSSSLSKKKTWNRDIEKTDFKHRLSDFFFFFSSSSYIIHMETLDTLRTKTTTTLSTSPKSNYNKKSNSIRAEYFFLPKIFQKDNDWMNMCVYKLHGGV